MSAFPVLWSTSIMWCLSLSLSFFKHACLLSIACSFLYKEQKEQYDMYHKWHIFIYNECKYTCTCNCTSIQKLEIFMRNTHSSHKHFPVGSQYMFLLYFYIVKCHSAEHASHISHTFLAKPFMIFHFSSNTKDFHSSCMCRHKCWCSGLHLYLCFCHFLLILFNVSNQILQFPIAHLPHQVLIAFSNILLYTTPNHMPVLFSLFFFVNSLYILTISAVHLYAHHHLVNVLKCDMDSDDMIWYVQIVYR